MPPPAEGASGDASLLDVVRPAALDDVDSWPAEDREAWADWLRRYWERVDDDCRPVADRLGEMRGANPKYILRNWMAKEAYEAAAGDDCEAVREVLEVLSQPYEEQSVAAEERWGRPTPQWAREKMGIAFMT